MTGPPVSELQRYRIERAWSTIEEAVLLSEKQHLASAVNRLYYACFYAASALLLKHELSFRRHSGLISAFNREFVKTGMMQIDTGAVIAKLFSHRQRADYDDLTQFEPEQIARWVNDVRCFVTAVSDLLSE